MNEFMIFYRDLLVYLFTHPVESFFILLAQYIIAMKMYYAIGNKVVHGIVLAWFLPQDFVVNVSLFTLVGLGDLPREGTVTERLKRWKKITKTTWPNRWRVLVAWKLCALLNKFDKDGHC